ncbi:AbiJ-NTD4 domain-containing protein [Piscirickettsia salmonis]|uniref:AbiJ-NTD4 domain-containing protein n=1 Tax=Piscirickettsia salmonis TaxID=1238 RepID=UPI0012BA7B4F|nr:hypothetical protein [Piscirickettsia salmonis]
MWLLLVFELISAHGGAMKFSHRYGFDPEYKNEPIVHDAPSWLKNMFFNNVLAPLLFIDGDNRYKNEERKPLGVKLLIETLCSENGHETDNHDFNSWSCWEAIEIRIKGLEWYQFYDAVETIGKLIKKNEAQYDVLWDSGSNEEYMFCSYRQKVNDLFSQHKVQWKLSEANQLETPLPRDLESRINAAESTLKSEDRFEPARVHYVKARDFALSPHKDYENSIKESISALESVGRVLYPKKKRWVMFLKK